jgi:hypothetical protein
MRFNEETRKNNLDGVPRDKQVFIYDASIIIEFLDKTFMPLNYFLNYQAMNEIGPGIEIQPKHFKDPKDMEKKMTMGDLYDIYKMFRQQMPYTREIESHYKFSVIVKKLRYRPNRWQFRVRRTGRAQFIYLSPLELRVRVAPEIKKQYPPGGTDLAAGQVPLTPEDHQDEVRVEPDTNDPSQYPAEGSDTVEY